MWILQCDREVSEGSRNGLSSQAACGSPSAKESGRYFWEVHQWNLFIGLGDYGSGDQAEEWGGRAWWSPGWSRV